MDRPCHLPPSDDPPRARAAPTTTGTGLTIGPHPMSFGRRRLALRGVQRASDLPREAATAGACASQAGPVITRQRPGTAKGFVFLTLEDETGIANIIVRPDLFSAERRAIVASPISWSKGRSADSGRRDLGQGRARRGSRHRRTGSGRAQLLLDAG